VKGEVLPFRRLHAGELLEGHPLFLREPHGGRRRLTVGTDGGGYRRTGQDFLEIFLALGDLRNAGRQPSRGAEALDRRPRRDPELVQARRDPLADLPRERGHPRRGKLFDADFDEEFSIHPCCRLADA
jgi:hypothetical protein